MDANISLSNVRDILSAGSVVELSFLYRYKNRKYWKLVTPLTCQLSNGDTVTIPAGFITDLSSVPPFLWGVFRPFGDFLLAALIHDFLYIEKPFSREFADKEMLYWSNAVNGNKIDNYIRYFAVRAFGWTWWNNLFKY